MKQTFLQAGKSMFSSKRSVRLLVFLILTGLLYAGLSIFFFETDPFILFFNTIQESYLGVVISISSFLQNITGNEIYFSGGIFYDGEHELFPVTLSFLSRRWTFFIFLFIWLTPSLLKNKIWFSLKALLVNFSGSILQMVVAVKMSLAGYDAVESKNMGYTVIVVAYLLLLIRWIIANKEFFLRITERFGFNRELVIRKFSVLSVLWIISTVISHFLMSFFPLTLWINFLFGSTHHILNFLGYESYTDSHYLLGPNGNIYMAKYCLGLKTMMIFAFFIILTAKKVFPALWYILTGLILINLFNIGRFVLLFIYIQKHDYREAMDQHDLYNYAVYTFVFILWIIWLEKYSDIWAYIRKKPVAGQR